MRTASRALFHSGRGVCGVCRKPLPEGRVRWCSNVCSVLYRVMTNPQEMRKYVCKRDGGVCSMPDCRMDCLHLAEQLLPARSSELKAVRKAFKKFCKDTAFPYKRHSFWDADHITAVADGGGITGLSNVRTLCYWCHKRRNADQADIRAGRVPEKRPPGKDVIQEALRELLLALAERGT